MAARLGALVLAAAMVAGALYARSRIDEGSVHARLTCSTELADACGRMGSGVEVRVEAAGVTADRLSALQGGQDAGLDGWLVAGPWPAIVDAERHSRGLDLLFAAGVPALAASPLGVAVESRRAPALLRACGDPPDWSCVGRALAKTWKELGGDERFGPVKADLPDPGSEATGVAVLGAAAAKDLAAGVALDANQGLQQLLDDLRRRQVRTAVVKDALATELTTNGADLDVVAATEAEATTVLSQAATGSAVRLLYPAPMAAVAVELATVGATAGSRRVRSVAGGTTGARALAAAHWKTGQPGTGLPDPGLLDALRRAWTASR